MVVGNIPEFSEDSEAIETSNDETIEKELDEDDGEDVEESESSTDKKPSKEDDEDESDEKSEDESEEDSKEDDEVPIEENKAIKGLKKTETKLDDEVKAIRDRIVNKRKQRRSIKLFEETYIKPESEAKNSDEDEDIDDYDKEFEEKIEKIIQKKGYIKKEEISQGNYNDVKQSEIDSFLEEFPEYQQEYDKGDVRWKELLSELALYAKPKDPHQIGSLLIRCHHNITGKVKSTLSNTQDRIKLASLGNGSQKSNYSSKTKSSNNSEQKAMLIKGGWSEEEADEIINT